MWVDTEAAQNRPHRGGVGSHHWQVERFLEAVDGLHRPQRSAAHEHAVAAFESRPFSEHPIDDRPRRNLVDIRTPRASERGECRDLDTVGAEERLLAPIDVVRVRRKHERASDTEVRTGFDDGSRSGYCRHADSFLDGGGQRQIGTRTVQKTRAGAAEHDDPGAEIDECLGFLRRLFPHPCEPVHARGLAGYRLVEPADMERDGARQKPLEVVLDHRIQRRHEDPYSDRQSLHAKLPRVTTAAGFTLTQEAGTGQPDSSASQRAPIASYSG